MSLMENINGSLLIILTITQSVACMVLKAIFLSEFSVIILFKENDSKGHHRTITFGQESLTLYVHITLKMSIP